MANITKLIIPLVEGITQEYLDPSEKMGFINAYVGNINKPYMNRHLFLLYDEFGVSPDTFIKRNVKLSNNPNIYGKESITINGKTYMMYIFTIIDKDALKIKYEGILPTNKDKYLKIHKFWKQEDDFINNLIVDRFKSFDINDPLSLVPEQDLFLPEHLKGERLIIKNPGT